MRKNKLITAITIAGIVLALNSCKDSHANEAEQKAPVAPPVTDVTTVQKDKLSTTLQLPGELIAFQQVDLYAKVNSFVKELKVDIGSEVHEGQLLIVLEAPEINSQVAAAESRLKAQEAIYTASKASYNRLLETSKVPGTVSPNDIDLALAKQNSDLAQLEAARASYKELNVMNGYLEIRAPFSGVITARNVNTGAYVGPSGRGSEFPLFTLQQQSKLRLAVAIPEAYTGYLKDNNEIKFRVRSVPGETFKAQIKRRAGALDYKFRSERVEMDVENKNKKLLPGTVAEVIVPLPAQDSTLIVPKSAVVSADEGVYVIKVEDNKAVRIPVKKGRLADDKVEIFGDLNEGDVLVLKASEEIKDGSTLTTAKK